MPKLTVGPEIAFLRHVEPMPDDRGCWEWNGTLNKTGYGQVQFGGKTMLAHRVSLMLAGVNVGNAQVLHRCDNPSCVKPDHLRLGDHNGNMADMAAKGRAAKFSLGQDVPCPRGHVGNFRYGKQEGKYQQRRCRDCDNQQKREAYRGN